MLRTVAELRANAERIWRTGVAAVMPARLIACNVRVDGTTLHVDDDTYDLGGVRRIAIVGGGKAAGAMAVALEGVLRESLVRDVELTGWVNVPAYCVVPSEHVVIHAARPAGVNEPRAEGAYGTQRILEIVSSLAPSDVCICVLTGGGSALLPAPVPEISLDEKIQLTRLMSAAGANIEQLNTVRRQLSCVKGGGLARACSAGRLVTLVISDVPGDPLEAIASGPAFVERATTASDAVAVLEELQVVNEPSIGGIVRYLRGRANERPREAKLRTEVTHHILGNNATAVDAAGVEAERLGYSHAMISATKSEGAAEEVGRHLAGIALRMRREAEPDCLISGGEPTVTLVDESRRGKGGRNQQLMLAALMELGDCEGIAMLSGGTDGEDGPTDAAGALVTAEVVKSARRLGLDARSFLERNDAYHFFERAGGLFVTGPTQTNVCDLRVVVVGR